MEKNSLSIKKAHKSEWCRLKYYKDSCLENTSNLLGQPSEYDFGALSSCKPLSGSVAL